MQENPTSQTQSTYDLLDALKQPGCPICSLGLRAVAHYIDATNYDSVGDPGIQKQLQAALGFCNLHAYQWLHAAFILGTADIYQAVLRTIVVQLREHPYSGPGLADRLLSFLDRGRSAPATTTDRIVQATAPCPVCTVLANTEQMLVRTLMRAVTDPGFREAYLGSAGLCLPHLRTALATPSNFDAFATVRDHAVRTEEALLEQLAEIIRKHDYRYLDEPAGDEKGAVARAVAHVAGARGIM